MCVSMCVAIGDVHYPCRWEIDPWRRQPGALLYMRQQEVAAPACVPIRRMNAWTKDNIYWQRPESSDVT